MAPGAYRLRAELLAHTSDVRGVACNKATGTIATASRDSSVHVWDLDKTPDAPVATLRGHDHFVNAVAFLENGELVSASSDKTLRIWEPSGWTCRLVIRGHENNVCHVAPLAGGRILSCSWDKTARVWDASSGQCIAVLNGHEAAVWAGLGLVDGRIVTVGADKTSRLWNGAGDLVTVLQTAHGDVVRGIASAPDGGFLTVANDSAAIRWESERGSFMPTGMIPDVHDGSFAYTVDGVESATGAVYVSGGEDCCVRVIEVDQGMDVVQTIMCPAVVWSVSIMGNGDLVAGCSDGVTRVFTKDPSRFAHDDIVAAFEKAVSGRQLNTKVIGGVDVAKLPGAADALSMPGKKDGENKMVRTSTGAAEVHMWSAAENKWSKVGDIVEGPGGGASMGGGEVNGKKYDFVFDVEIGQGGAKKPLGYNKGENTYLAAQRFIDDNDLNQDFLDQIATFIDQQLPADAAPPSGAMASDPLTGGSRYVPGGSRGGGSFVGSGDPLTGGSRYVPGGGNAAARVLPPPRNYLPYPTGVVTYVTTDQIDKVQTKLAESNSTLAIRGDPLALNEDEAGVFGLRLMAKLKDKSGGSSMFDDDEAAVVEKMLEWPTKMVFPVMDVARLVIARPTGSSYFFGKKNGVVVDTVLRHMSSVDAKPAVLIMGCRFLCNMFENRVAATIVREKSKEILKAASAAAKSENRKARETHASLLINYAVSLHSSSATPEDRVLTCQTAIALINSGEKDEEIVFRLLVAVGTLMCGGKDNAKKGVELGAATAAASVAGISARIQQVATEMATLIAS